MSTEPCTVIPFPATRRVGRIRRAAEVLAERRGKSADQYWRQVASGMQSQMAAAGIPDEVIAAEIHDFFRAVQREMVRQSYAGRSGGAA